MSLVVAAALVAMIASSEPSSLEPGATPPGRGEDVGRAPGAPGRDEPARAEAPGSALRPGGADDRREAASDPDEDVVRNLDVLQDLELLEHLDLLDPGGE